MTGPMQCSKTPSLFDHLIGAQARDIGHDEAEQNIFGLVVRIIRRSCHWVHGHGR
jgi:hypothetical protein